MTKAKKKLLRDEVRDLLIELQKVAREVERIWMEMSVEEEVDV